MPCPSASCVHFGDQKYAIALTGDHAADQLLGAAVAIHFRRVDQRHPERKAGAQRFFLNRLPDVFPVRGARDPWPSAGTTVPSRSFTVRPARGEVAPVAASSADAPEGATNEPSATQSPLNSRRFSKLISPRCGSTPAADQWAQSYLVRTQARFSHVFGR